MRVKICQVGKTAMQSGRRQVDEWVITPDNVSASLPEPLMGWTGGASTLRQVRLSFPTCEQAINHARRNGWAYRLQGTVARKITPRAYADNFAYQRRQPWTH